MPIGSLPKTLLQTQDANLEHERLTSLINSMADGVIATDETFKIVLYNAAALDILDRNTSIQDKQLSEVLHLIDRKDDEVDINKMLRELRVPTTNRDYRIRYASDSSVINLYLSVAPVHLGYGKAGKGGFVVLLRDITREKSLEEERDEFISVASHELRTPVAITEGSVSNALFILKKGGTMEEVTKALESTHQQVLFLTDLINDLSTLSRAEQGKLQVDLEDINVSRLVTDLIDNYRTQVEQKGLKIVADLDPSLEILVSSQLYVREILQNFITNSIKYTSVGQITVSAHSAQGGVQFTVTDTGIGISKSDQTKVFTKFFRSEDFRTRQSSGTGLGLYVSRKLAKLLHANIGLESQLNHGSAFSIFVPNLNKSVATAVAKDKA